MTDGEYKLSVYELGDLSESPDAWKNTILATEDATSSAVAFKMPGTADILPEVTKWKLEGESSIVGRGVQLFGSNDQLLARGVVGVKGKANSLNSTIVNAACQLQPIKNAPFNVTGQVFIRQSTDRTTIKARVEGLQNNAMYGFHIHEIGDLGSDNGMSTGGHYNPANVTHKLPGGAEYGHVGDLGNIAYYDNDGVAWYFEEKLNAVKLTEEDTNVMGRAIVVHSQRDDGCTQPTGGAGDRIAFCIIGVSKQGIPKMGWKFDTLPAQTGSTGCGLKATPTNSPRSPSFVWVAVVICVALAGIGAMFAYNWWKSKNNPTTNAANGRQPWYAHQNEDSGSS